MSEYQDRFIGALVGLAIGDALGAPLEFAQRDVLPALTGMQGGGKFGLEPGRWTDDTSMALCIATSLIETRTFDLRDQLVRFVKWRDEGYFASTGRCFGIGQQTFRALNDFVATGLVARDATARSRSGNGSLMRLAPIPMAFVDDMDFVARASAASSITTHPNDECQEACAAFGGLVAGAIRGWSREEILIESRRLAEGISTPALREVLRGGYLEKTRDQISSTGYVVDTLEAALWAFMQAADFESGALLAVNLAHDADTIGAVYGQLAGAHFGVSDIPSGWRAQLYEIDTITGIAEKLYDQLSSIEIAAETIELIPPTQKPG